MVPGNSKSLWDAVGASRDIGANLLPESMTLGNLDIGEHERSSRFASCLNVLNGSSIDTAKGA